MTFFITCGFQIEKHSNYLFVEYELHDVLSYVIHVTDEEKHRRHLESSRKYLTSREMSFNGKKHIEGILEGVWISLTEMKSIKSTAKKKMYSLSIQLKLNIR